MDVATLRRSGVALAVKPLRTHAAPEVAALATKLWRRWKATARAEGVLGRHRRSSDSAPAGWGGAAHEPAAASTEKEGREEREQRRNAAECAADTTAAAGPAGKAAKTTGRVETDCTSKGSGSGSSSGGSTSSVGAGAAAAGGGGDSKTTLSKVRKALERAGADEAWLCRCKLETWANSCSFHRKS
eukprot:SAG11_NODE_691_length_7699_cov_3.868026_4_plen_186_part_00